MISFQVGEGPHLADKIMCPQTIGLESSPLMYTKDQRLVVVTTLETQLYNCKKKSPPVTQPLNLHPNRSTDTRSLRSKRFSLSTSSWPPSRQLGEKETAYHPR
ncbi:hypothetical protein SCA6_009563 [Theobroma cacao]